VTVEVVGVLLGVFAGVASLVIYIGGFSEQNRANEDFSKLVPKP